MLSAFFVAVLSYQAAQHRQGECSCGVVVTSYLARVEGEGSLPRVTFTPYQTAYRRCPHAQRTSRRTED